MNFGFVLLAIWLILTGLITLFNFTFQGIGVIMGILALLAGVFLLIGDNLRGGRGNGGRRGSWRWNIGPGILLLAIWLILTGLIALFSFTFEGIGLIMGILALAAGLLLLIRR